MAGSKLKAFARRISLGDEALLKAANVIRKEFLILIDEGFRDKKDPIGRKWKPRKSWYAAYLRRGGRPYPLMNKTLDLRHGWYVKVSAGPKVTIGNKTGYTGFHQDGTRKMEARKMVPDQRLSPKWRSRINKVLDKALAEHFRGR
jgi:hypothetical protein